VTASPPGGRSEGRRRFGIHTSGSPLDRPQQSSSKQHFVESVVLTWAGNFARIVLGLVALRLVTGAIPEADLGAYWILTSVAALLGNFADLGVGLGIARHLPLCTDPHAARRMMHTVLALRGAALALLCLVLAVAKPWVLQLFAAESIESRYFYVYVFVVVSSAGELYTNFLQGLNRFRAMALYALISSLARLLLIVVCVRGFGLQVDGLFLAEALSLALGAWLSAWSSAHGWRPRFDGPEAVRLLRFGWPLHVNTLLSYASTRLNTLLIANLTGPVAVSHFSVASRVPDQLSMVLRSYTQVYLPSMSRFAAAAETERARRLLASSLRLMSFCFAVLTLGLGFFRHELLALLAPPSYQVAAPAVPLLLGALAFAALGSVLGNTLVALGDSHTPLRINFWTSAVSLALNLTFIRAWGLMGAAWAHFAFHVVAYAVTDVVVSRRIRPASRGYLGLLVYLAAILLAGLQAGIALRAALLVVGTGGSLALSRPLRQDLIAVWNSRRGA